ncbi:MAG: FMN-binding protein [Actinomycetota bacterium]|nr:FMN-binding protein [Actinomycetota bacterium]
MTPRLLRPISLGFAGLGLIGALAGCSAASATDASTTAGSDTSSGSNSSTAASAAYKDGTYTENGDYTSPGGPQSVTVKLTLTGNKVTAVTVTGHASDPTAKSYQAQFVGGISAEVVGKDIDSLNVSRVAGSSLTSGGFNAALKAIKADALAS